MVTAKQPKKSQERQVYQFKITLADIKPPIWRRFQVTSDISLGVLREVLQIVMGWTDSHLHQFIINGSYYSFGDSDLDMEAEDEDKKKLYQVVKAEGDSFVYEYDFGDGWTHKVILEKILPVEAGIYPHCLTGKRSCPPEDCGGPFGYGELLEILKNPRHDEYKSYLEWLGGKFNSEKFDMENVNSELATLGLTSKKG